MMKPWRTCCPWRSPSKRLVSRQPPVNAWYKAATTWTTRRQHQTWTNTSLRLNLHTESPESDWYIPWPRSWKDPHTISPPCTTAPIRLHGKHLDTHWFHSLYPLQGRSTHICDFPRHTLVGSPYSFPHGSGLHICWSSRRPTHTNGWFPILPLQ